ncbi:hypothetical protein EI74_0731 [Mycoplasma testudineum]|uniref:Uncharacterized protein n=1 Tax=Mycoplasma testudineum TaxID=244584 RepID=A0A4R6IB85_9MOLU|nr:ECF transporter S component [Mycoplasma testudineum]OYD26624.1 hypothetical protein CG473_03250 [Mycoplasma testudineum]TDO19460.1 hypothetical protein EI74_0731 [Mycoplasma testudineum]
MNSSTQYESEMYYLLLNMNKFIKIWYKLKISKLSPYVYIFALFTFIALGVLIYGLVYFSTSGTINHGDHVDIRVAFIWDHNSVLFISLGISLTISMLIADAIVWILIYKNEIWWIHAIVNSKWYLRLVKKRKIVDTTHPQSQNYQFKKIDISKLVFEKIEKITFSKIIFQDFLATSKMNSKGETYKIALTAILLGLSVILSMLEIPGIPLPWGSAFMLRIFETMVLILAIKMIGVLYTLIIATSSPWLHFAIHAVHSPIDVVFYMVNNVLVVFIFYALYYLLFRASTRWAYEKDDKNKKYLVNTKSIIVRKVISLTLFSFLAALSEAFGFLATYFLVTGEYTSIVHKIYYDSLDNRGLNNINNAVAFISTLSAIFLVKYLLESLIFVATEKKIIYINRQFGLV